MTSTATTPTTSNSLKHTIITKYNDKETIKIVIKLADECKNGHADFSITGDIYETNRPKTGWKMGGCIHKEIISVMPNLKQFITLHLSDFKGAPMYAIENGFYFLKNEKKAVTMEFLRINDEEFNLLDAAEDKKYFSYLLHSLNIPARWQIEANQAIKELEALTGLTYLDNSTRSQLEDINMADMLDIENKIKSGYYTSKNINDRNTTKKNDEKNKIRTDLITEKDKAIKKLTDEFNVKIAIMDADFPLNNFIYYNHKNEGVFNWLDYQPQITENEFINFLNLIDYTTLPKGIIFKLKS